MIIVFPSYEIFDDNAAHSDFFQKINTSNHMFGSVIYPKITQTKHKITG